MGTGKRFYGLAGITVALLALFTLVCCSKNEDARKNLKDSDILTQAEVMPAFPGGDAALLKFISENVRYPEIAKAEGIQGKVIMRFCVTDKGKVERVSVEKGADPELDKEGIRVISSLPKFKPAMQDGKPVAVWFMVPITFRLK